MNLTEGTLLGGRYRIVKFIGQGGFGCTYLVQHTHLKKRFAIKEFFPADLCNRNDDGRVYVGTDSKVQEFGKLLGKFIKEANALVDFSGIKGIVNVVDVFEENGTAYFVMDYIEGMSVEKMLQLEGPMTEKQAVEIIRKTAKALDCVHKRNYLHLDIKPDNIMLDFDYNPVLIDFGVSKQYDASDGHNSSTLLGFTPGFAPMEQSNSKVGKFYPATDIYSLGATLYCMLTGKTPDTASDRFNYPRPITEDLPAGTSPNVTAAIDAAMQLRVSDRPQSISEFLRILDGGEQTSTIEDTPHKTQRQNPTTDHKTSSFKKFLPAAIICVVIILGAIIFLTTNGTGEKAENYNYADTDTIVALPIIETADSSRVIHGTDIKPAINDKKNEQKIDKHSSQRKETTNKEGKGYKEEEEESEMAGVISMPLVARPELNESKTESQAWKATMMIDIAKMRVPNALQTQKQSLVDFIQGCSDMGACQNKLDMLKGRISYYHKLLKYEGKIDLEGMPIYNTLYSSITDGNKPYDPAKWDRAIEKLKKLVKPEFADEFK